MSEHLFGWSFGGKGGKVRPSFDSSGSPPRHELFPNFDGSAANVNFVLDDLDGSAKTIPRR